MKLKKIFSKQRLKNISDHEEQQENARKIETFILKSDQLVEDNGTKENKIRKMFENIEVQKSAQNEQVCFYSYNLC